ncbi:MAG: hypothetical protein V7642_2993 [Burkholderiales bacterium]|jgi:hypothetical protein
MKIKTTLFLLALVSAGAASAEEFARGANRGPNSPASQQAGPVSAQTDSTSTAIATSVSGGGTGVGAQGQSLSIDSHATYEAQSRNPVATAAAPAIVSSNDTCMGSTSIAASAVSFGFSTGTTWTDDNCVMLKNSREMWNMGFKGAALARLCMDQLNKEAFEATGINCPPRREKPTAERGTTADRASASPGPGKWDDIYR